jgi:hypothetical protein
MPTLQHIETTVPRDRWLILVVNDGPHEDFSDLADQNVAYFTFKREPESERNGCMIRNYILKRLRCRVVATRDPEIIVCGDIVQAVIGIDDETVYRPHMMVELQEPYTKKILADPTLDPRKAPARAVHRLVNPREPRAFHAGVAMTLKKALAIGGYDEEYQEYYGWEDIDFLHRLDASGGEIVVDIGVKTYHIWHPRKQKFLRTVRDNQRIFEFKKRVGTLQANQLGEWGNGI